MQANAKKAFEELKKMGVPVKDAPDHGGHFWISAEEENSHEWLDYYDGLKSWSDWMINDKIHAVLEKHNLFAEWYNPAYVIVYDN